MNVKKWIGKERNGMERKEKERKEKEKNKMKMIASSFLILK